MYFPHQTFNHLFNTLYICLCLLFCHCQVPVNQAAIQAQQTLSSHQLLVVITSDWDAVTGKLWKLQKEKGKWVQHGEAIPVTVGKKGMFWGKGLADDSQVNPLQVKQEGDKKSPAGLFSLITAFGYAAPDSLVALHFPYEHVTAFTQCIEDGASAYYNRIVNDSSIEADWNSTDHMLRKDDLYQWGVWVGHNYGSQTKAGDGSCIFLHAWRSSGSGTAGCTAMAPHHVKDIVFWLDENKQPALLQLPQAVYNVWRERYGLPIISL